MARGTLNFRGLAVALVPIALASACDGTSHPPAHGDQCLDDCGQDGRACIDQGC